MVTRVTLHGDDATTSEAPSSKSFTSSNDYRPQAGVTVRSTQGMGADRQVISPDQIDDTDLVEVDGMQISGKMARDLGLMPQLFGKPAHSEDGLSIGSLAAAAEEHRTAQEQPRAAEGTPEADFEGSIDALNAALEDGSIDMPEAQTYQTALGEIALAGMSQDQFVETLAGIEAGEVDANDLPADVRQVADAVVDKVHEAATTAAMAELGPDAFDALSQMATAHPGVNDVITRYATDRARGLHEGVTWADLYADLQAQLAG